MVVACVAVGQGVLWGKRAITREYAECRVR